MYAGNPVKIRNGCATVIDVGHMSEFESQKTRTSHGRLFFSEGTTGRISQEDTMAITHSPSNTTESAALAVIVAATILLAFVVLYLVGFDQGAISRSGMYVHELMHDGRHLLGLPCH